jgi:cell division protein ZapA
METITPNRVTVHILGEDYSIRGNADAGYIAEVAQLVDSKMRALKSTHRNLTKTRLAVLTAINLADEILQERSLPVERPDGEPDEIERRAKQLITLLDEGLIADGI